MQDTTSRSTPGTASPPPPPPGTTGKPSRRRLPWPLRLAWGLFRAGVIVLALLVLATALGRVTSSIEGGWILAALITLVLPTLLLVWLRRNLHRRQPNARVKLSLSGTVFGWSLLALLISWLSMPGLGTESMAVQGVVVSRWLGGLTGSDHWLPRAARWTGGALSEGFERLETGAFGAEKIAPRVKVARQVLASAGPGGADTAVPPGVEGGPALLPEGTPGLAPLPGQGPSGLEPGVAGAPPAGTGVPLAGEVGQPGSSGVMPGAGAGTGPAAPGSVASGTGTGSSFITTPGPFPMPLPAPAGASTAATPAPAAAPVIEVPYHAEGNNILVDVVLNRRFPARLLLDTGSSFTTLDSGTLKLIGLLPAAGAPTLTVNTAKGAHTDALTVLDTLAFGGYELSGVTVLRCDACTGPDHRGLLGMNVLNNFAVTLDQSTRTVRLEDRRARTDSRADVRPFITLEVTPEVSSTPQQPFFVTAVNRSSRPIQILVAELKLFNQEQQVVATHAVPLPSLLPGQRQSARIEVPREPKFSFYQVDVSEARW